MNFSIQSLNFLDLSKFPFLWYHKFLLYRYSPWISHKFHRISIGFPGTAALPTAAARCAVQSYWRRSAWTAPRMHWQAAVWRLGRWGWLGMGGDGWKIDVFFFGKMSWRCGIYWWTTLDGVKNWCLLQFGMKLEASIMVRTHDLFRNWSQGCNGGDLVGK